MLYFQVQVETKAPARTVLPKAISFWGLGNRPGSGVV